MRAASISNPQSGVSGAADVLAGYCIAASAMPTLERAAAIVPLLFVSAYLLRSAGSVFDVCFAVASGRTDPARASRNTAAAAVHITGGEISLTGALVTGAVLAALGLFAALAAAVSVGKLPVYVAAALFLVIWARTGFGIELVVLGPVSGGAIRALGLALGMSAHPDVVYLTDRAVPIALGLYFAYGALVEVLEHAEGEGGRRYALVGAAVGLVGVFAAAAALIMRTPLSLIVAVVGAAFLTARAYRAATTLLPGAIARLAEGAGMASGFLAAALCFGHDVWRTGGGLLVLGSFCLGLVVVTGVLSDRYGSSFAPADQRGLL